MTKKIIGLLSIIFLLNGCTMFYKDLRRNDSYLSTLPISEKINVDVYITVRNRTMKPYKATVETTAEGNLTDLRRFCKIKTSVDKIDDWTTYPIFGIITLGWIYWGNNKSVEIEPYISHDQIVKELESYIEKNITFINQTNVYKNEKKFIKDHLNKNNFYISLTVSALSNYKVVYDKTSDISFSYDQGTSTSFESNYGNIYAVNVAAGSLKIYHNNKSICKYTKILVPERKLLDKKIKKIAYFENQEMLRKKLLKDVGNCITNTFYKEKVKNNKTTKD